MIIIIIKLLFVGISVAMDFNKFVLKIDNGRKKQTEDDSEEDMKAFENLQKQHLVTASMKSSP